MIKPGKSGILVVSGLILVMAFLANLTGLNAADLSVAPDKTAISPDLIKEPIMFNGSGWKPNEMVIIDLVLPAGVKVKGASEGENVGIAMGNADANGGLKAKVDPMTVLMTFLQVGWDDNTMKPDFTQSTPLPPGNYTLKARGVDSGVETQTTLTIVPTLKKE